MNRTVTLVASGVALGLVLAVVPCQASLLTPADPSAALQVSADGKPVPLGAVDFKVRLDNLNFALDDRKPTGDYNAERKKFLKLIEQMEGLRQTRKLTAEETSILAAYLIRIGNLDKADALLVPLSRDRRPDYFAMTTRGHLFALRGSWRDAIENHQVALQDCEMPASVKGLSPSQRAWWKKLDDEVVPWFYQLRKQQDDDRKDVLQAELVNINNAEQVLPLFPLSSSHSPPPSLRFVSDAGVYQPGQLAAGERAKLPPDAIAIVQQLLLWFPGETRLYWLLAELYAANNDLASADLFFEQCANGRQYANRKVMMEHRAAVRAALQKRTPTEEVLVTSASPPSADKASPSTDDSSPITMKTVWWYFGAIGVVVLFAIVRGKLRRNRNDCAPTS